MTQPRRRILMIGVILLALTAEGGWSLWPSWHPEAAVAKAFSEDVQVGHALRNDIQNAYQNQEGSGAIVSLDGSTDISPVVAQRIPDHMLVDEARHILEYAGFEVRPADDGPVQATAHLVSPTYILQPEIWVHVTIIPSPHDDGLTVSHINAWIQRPS